ncbi:hypothetical protein [Pseudomonas sp. CGJS7]|uniref:hypothetical protein n=1 Tax=Pseudomonas sp. CGJS7 TaxID=3109348 RepID=UPI00300B86E7
MKSEDVVIEHHIREDTWSPDEQFPRTYLSTWTTTGPQRFPGPFETVCRTALPVTEATFKLQALNANFGRLFVTLDTFDRIGNYPGHNVAHLESEIPIAWGVRIRIQEAGSQVSVDYYGSSLSGTPMLEIGFSAPWKARRGDRVCFQGVNTFKRIVNLTRIAVSGDDKEFSMFSAQDS